MAESSSDPAGSPRTLAELNAYIRRRVAARQAAGAPAEAGDPDELASVRRFRAAWGRSRTIELVREAAARTPANAGPLNSHALVLRSLERMGELSPDYLRRFIAQVETLHWLQRAADQGETSTDPRKAVKGRRKQEAGRSSRAGRQKPAQRQSAANDNGEPSGTTGRRRGGGAAPE